MNKNPTCQTKKRTSGKIQMKSNDKYHTAKNDQFTLSTMASKSSTEIRWRRRNISQQKITKKKQKGWKKKHPRKNEYGSELPLPLIENSANRYYSEHLEDILSFREYCMIEGKWIPLLTTTQRQKIKMLQTKPNITQMKQNHSESEKELIKNQLQCISQHPEPVQVLHKKTQIISSEPDNLNPLPEPVDDIDQLFSRLQFFYLPNEKTLKQIPKQQKDHYQKLISSLMRKMNNTDDQYVINQEEIGNGDLSPVKNLSYVDLNQKFNEQEERKNYHKLIYERECEQLGIIVSEKHRGLDQIRTDIVTILLYIETLFQLLQNELMNDVISQIKLAYGYRKFEKLKRLLLNKQLETNPQVIPPSLFHLIEQQNTQHPYATPHNAAIFDNINYHLLQFKPYYESEGECFPWNFYMSPSITFYQITPESLDVVLLEVKKKVIEECSMLCGLILDEEAMEAEVLLHTRRRQREDIMFKKYLTEQDYKRKQEVQLENSATLVVVEVANSIKQLLLFEFIQQFTLQ